MFTYDFEAEDVERNVNHIEFFGSDYFLTENGNLDIFKKCTGDV